MRLKMSIESLQMRAGINDRVKTEQASEALPTWRTAYILLSSLIACLPTFHNFGGRKESN